jgi:hypothetical protein
VEPTFWDFRSSGFQNSNHSTQQFLNSEGKRVEPTLRDFGVSNVKQQNTTIPEIVKRKERGTNVLGFQGSESRDFKTQNINHKHFPKLRIEKNVELTFRDFGFWGFKCQATTHNNSQISKVKGYGTNTSGFRVWGFICQTTSHTIPKF